MPPKWVLFHFMWRMWNSHFIAVGFGNYFYSTFCPTVTSNYKQREQKFCVICSCSSLLYTIHFSHEIIIVYNMYVTHTHTHGPDVPFILPANMTYGVLCEGQNVLNVCGTVNGLSRTFVYGCNEWINSRVEIWIINNWCTGPLSSFTQSQRKESELKDLMSALWNISTKSIALKRWFMNLSGGWWHIEHCTTALHSA